MHHISGSGTPNLNTSCLKLAHVEHVAKTGVEFRVATPEL